MVTPAARVLRMVVTVKTLRRRMADMAARAANGETILVVRLGRPYVLLRRALPGERCHTESITSFRNDLRRGLLSARRRPVRLSWRDDERDVVVTRVPRELLLRLDES
jgi:antitoxin (DNA-binding transcriptional repressor) of toxin-antitoxin stability system